MKHLFQCPAFKARIACLLIGVSAFGFLSCGDDYDDTEIRNNIEKLQDRVATLEKWQQSVNSDIQSLQALISALEGQNAITGVTPLMENGEETGYTISFRKGDPITIRHGEKGADGTNGITPVIGVARDKDGTYYWTVKNGDGKNEFLTDEKGNKIPTTGPKGDKGDQGASGEDGSNGTNGSSAVAPKVRINQDTKMWEISTDNGRTWASTGVAATGESLFCKVDYASDPAQVIFTLADGTTTFSVPQVAALTIGFESSDLFTVTPDNPTLKIVLSADLQEGDYTAITAELKIEGENMSISTRAESSGNLKITEPTFTASGEYNDDAAVSFTEGCIETNTGKKAILKVTVIDKDGQEKSASRAVAFDKENDALTLAARNGGAFTLQKDYERNASLVIAKGVTLTLDLNGKKITDKGNGAAILVKGDLTIQGGEVVGGSGGNNVAIQVAQGGKLTIVDGTYSVGADARDEGNSCIYNVGGDIEIRGGTFKTEKACKGFYYVLNQENVSGGTIKVSGGIFENYDPAGGDDHGQPTDFVADGYSSIKIKESPETFQVVKGEGITSPAELEDAIQKAIKSGTKTVTIVKPITFASDVTLNGGGVIFEGSPISFNGNTIVKEVTFNNGHNANGKGSAVYITNKAQINQVIFEGCTFADSDWEAIQITNPNIKSITVKDCVFRYTKPSKARHLHIQLLGSDGRNIVSDNTTLLLEGCTFENIDQTYCPMGCMWISGIRFNKMTISGNYLQGAGSAKFIEDGYIGIANYVSLKWEYIPVNCLRAGFTSR